MRLPSANRLFRVLKSNRTTLYAMGASIGVVGTGYTCAKAALKTREYKQKNPNEPRKERVKGMCKIWLVPVAIGGATIFCIWRAEKIHLEREASLATLSAYWQTKYNKLEKKVKEKLSDDEYREIHREIQEETLAGKNVPSSRGLPEGMFWVYDEMSDQFIKTSGMRITWAKYTINERFSAMRDVEYNWVLSLIGGKTSDKLKGLGWTWDNEELIETMDYNTGFMHLGQSGYWLDICADYHIDDAANKVKDGVTIPYLWCNYQPELIERRHR